LKVWTKLALLLSAALIVTTVASTAMQVIWTTNVLEKQASKQATAAAEDIKADLEKSIKDDTDSDDIAEILKDEQRRHRVATIELIFDDAEDATVSFSLGFQEEEPKIKKTQRPVKKKAGVRRDEIRRALSDHGESLRPPVERVVEAMWRTPERGESPAWSQLAASVPPPKRPPRAFLVDLREEEQRRARAMKAEVELVAPRHALLRVSLSLDAADRLATIEKIVSATVTGTALLLLLLVTAYIANRIVGRPVTEIADAMSTVGEGDLSRRVDPRSSDEVGMLARGFNSMTERLAIADEEIRAFNRRLADEVAAATVDLERKNEALGHLNRLLLETRRELGDKERLAALGQLAAQLAHEIGTPLGSVSGHIQLALGSRDLPASVKERLLVVTKEVERVGKIVRDYLDSTRPIKPARLETDLVRLVDEACGIALGAAEHPGLFIERRIPPSAAQVETDPGLLRQILVNLLTNAIDAVGGREAGRGRIVVSSRESGGAIEISVADDGVGIGPEDAARIFEPFYTTKGRGKGTGLGLAICRELATALDGRIAVESRPGQGSTFTLRLPLGGRAITAPHKLAARGPS
jgi:signal transduction histidine kinase